MGHLGAILNAIATSQCRYIWFKTQKADRWLDAHQPLAMKVLILFFIVLAPLWVSEAKFNFQGISSGIRSILGSVSKTVIKSSIKELGSRSLQKIEDTVSKNLAQRRWPLTSSSKDLNLIAPGQRRSPGENWKFLRLQPDGWDWRIEGTTSGEQKCWPYADKIWDR